MGEQIENDWTIIMSVMTRLHIHHTGGAYKAIPLDRSVYHRLVEGDGTVVAGQHSILANAPGKKLQSGAYAAHTRNSNSGAIGLSVCCMGDGVWASPFSAKLFPKKEQMDATIAEAARLCRTWGIEVTRRTVLTHAEVQRTLGIAQRGKWDFDYDPFGVLTTRDPIEIGDMLREKIGAHLRLLPDVSGVEVPVTPERVEIVTQAKSMPVLRRGSFGEAVKVMQKILGVDADGAFGPKTEAAVLKFQRSRQLSPDGVVGKATWSALLSI